MTTAMGPKFLFSNKRNLSALIIGVTIAVVLLAIATGVAPVIIGR